MSTSALLEREGELETLSAAIAAAADGEAALVLVQGPAGIGKSRLLAEARRLGEEHGLCVRSARGGELERDFPFGIVRQLYESQLVGESERERLLAGAAGAAAAVFGYRDGDGGEPLGEGLFRVLHGLYWLTVNLSSERPLLLVVDDLHWCDSASLRFLAYLARRLDELPVVLVASVRSSEPDADREILEELLSEPSARMLMPGPLSTAAVAELVRERLGEGVEAAFTEACHSSTDGNPLLLNELLKALVLDRVPPDAAHVDVVAELGPRSASRAVLLRLSRLSRDAGEVALALSVLGDGAEFTTVAELAELEPLAVASATRELVRAEILRPEPPLGFVHALVRAAVYHDLTPGERELFHERAATLLVRLGAAREKVAAHLLELPARGEEWVVDCLRSAADAAVARGDPDAAVSLLRRALDEPPRPELRLELLLALGRVEAMTSLPAAVGHLRSAYELAREPSVRGMAADQLARSLVFLEAPDEGAAIAAGAARELPAELADFARRLEAVELFALVFGARPDGDRRERLRAYWDIDPSRGGVGVRSLAAVAAWNWTMCAGPADRVCALARSALQGDELLAADGLMPMVAGVPLALADLDDAVDAWDAQRTEGHRRGSMFRIAGVQLWSGHTHLLRGELGEAESELRASLETLTLWGMSARAQWTAPILAEVLIERGALDQARALLDGAGTPPAASDQAMLVDRAWMRLLLAEGRPEEALDYADGYALRAGWKRHPRYVPWRSLKAQALDRLGRHDEAAELAGEELEIALGWGSPGTVGRSLRVLGTMLRADGIEPLEEACALLEQAPARLEHAKALAALGSVLRRARKPREAREPLRRALELADACGAQPLAETVRAEIYATGARPRTTALRGILALTASERRVADLAAGGQTNRDIAQSLYVTPKTVEVHLSNAYRKLGIGSRRELERALAGE